MFGLGRFGGGKEGSGPYPSSAGLVRGHNQATAPLARQANPDPAPPSDVNRLVIGQGLTFQGVIGTCDHLTISGDVTSEVEHCNRLEIAAGGSFHGRAAAREMTVAGAFDGDLTVFGCLRIAATGSVKGRVSYGALAIEQGGRLSGTVVSLADAATDAPVVVPLRRSGDADVASSGSQTPLDVGND